MWKSLGMPLLNFEAFDPFELGGIAGDEGGAEAAGLGGDEEVEGADGFSLGLKFSANLGIVKGRSHVEVGDVEKVEEGLEPPGLMRMGGEILLHAGP